MRLVPDFIFTEGEFRPALALTVSDGVIAGVEPAGAPRPGDLSLPRRALLPGTVNSHCHTFQSLLRGLGDDLDFVAWRDRVLYPFSERLDREALALGAAFGL